MPPIDFCNRSRPTSTPCGLSEPGGRACEATSSRQLHPWQDRASRVVSSQGSTGDESPFRRPYCDRSPYGFTPIRLRLGHPHVAMLTPPPTGKVDCGDLRWRSLRRGSARLGTPSRGLATTEAVLPLGPSFPPLRANVAVADCTQGAFHPSHPLVAALARSFARGGG